MLDYSLDERGKVGDRVIVGDVYRPRIFDRRFVDEATGGLSAGA